MSCGKLSFRAWCTACRSLRKGLDTLIQILEDVPLPLAQVEMAGGQRSPESVRPATPYVQARRIPIVIGGHGPRTIDIAARVSDRWNIYYPPGVDGAEDLGAALRRINERFDQRCAVHGRSGQVERSIAFDLAPGLHPATGREMTEFVGRMWDLGYDECIAWGWPPAGSTNRSIEELLAFVTEDLPGLRTA